MGRTKLDTRTWGNTQDFHIATGTPTSLQQLLRVGYNPPQPVTWSFLFYLQLHQVSLVGPFTFDVYFDIYTGVGRSQVTLTGFEHFQTNIASGPTALVWSTSVKGPLRIAGDAASGSVVDSIVGESILVSPRATVTLGPVAIDATIGAFFSPLAHFPLTELEDILSGDPSKDENLRQLFAEMQTDEDNATEARHGRR